MGTGWPLALWFKCDVCGRFIPHADIADGSADHRTVEPETHFSTERYETLCRKHNDRKHAT